MRNEKVRLFSGGASQSFQIYVGARVQTMVPPACGFSDKPEKYGSHFGKHRFEDNGSKLWHLKVLKYLISFSRSFLSTLKHMTCKEMRFECFFCAEMVQRNPAIGHFFSIVATKHQYDVSPRPFRPRRGIRDAELMSFEHFWILGLASIAIFHFQKCLFMKRKKTVFPNSVMRLSPVLIQRN